MTLAQLLHKAGVRRSHLQLASMGSVGLCITLWIRAKTVDQDERGNAERRALFVGLWPPTLWLMADSLGDLEQSLGTGLIHSADAPRALAELARRQINYDPATAPCDGRIAGHWHLDSGEIDLGTEAPGPPLTDGVFARACFLVRWYEFTDPAIVRAIYRADSDLLGRDMLLEARFFGLRFHLGVRVTAVLDEVRGSGSGAQRVWGWSYQTLQGHLEQGRLGYEVIKDLASGSVRFRVVGYSRAAPIRNPLIRLGFALFGRRTQTRFYRTIQQRMRTLVNGPADGRPLPGPGSRPDGVVVAPSGAGTRPQDRVGWWVHHPGR